MKPAPIAVACMAAALWSAASAQNKPPAKPATQANEVTLVCEAVYMPARTTWTRTVSIGYDKKVVRSVQIDGVPVYAFAIQETVILTSIDNERIQIDTAAQTWSSDFRGLATAMGRCERS